MKRYIYIASAALVFLIAAMFYFMGSRVPKDSPETVITKVSALPDTLEVFPEYDDPVMTQEQAFRSCPSILGGGPGTSDLIAKRYTNAHSRIVKTMYFQGSPVMLSESAVVMYNDEAPILMGHKFFFEHPELFPRLDSANVTRKAVNCSETLKDQFDLRLSDRQWNNVFQNSVSIELDSLAKFVPLIYIQDEQRSDLLHCIALECHLRGKGIVISSIDFDKADVMPEIKYLKEVLIHYTYSDHVRNAIPESYPKLNDESWFEYMIPGFQLHPQNDD